MKNVCRFTCAFVFATSLLVLNRVASADSNLHTLQGTFTGCQCDLLTSPPPQNHHEWYCTIHLSVAAPEPHYNQSNPVGITAVMEGQAIGQCGDYLDNGGGIGPMTVLFYLREGGPDFQFGIFRSPVVAYYLIPG